MTDITIELEDLIEAWGKSKNTLGFTPMDWYIKSITPEPEWEWERPALINSLYLGDDSCMHEKTFVKQASTLLIMESLWKKFGEGYEFTYKGRNFYPIFDHKIGEFSYQHVEHSQQMTAYCYNKKVSKVLEILTKLKAEGVI